MVELVGGGSIINGATPSSCRTPDWQSSPVQLLIGKSGRLSIRVVVWSVVRHGRDSSDVTLVLEDAQVVRRSVGRY